MSQASSQHDPLRELAAQYCDGSLSAEQTAALEYQLRDDPAAMESFVLYLEIHSQLAWDLRARSEQRRAGRETDGNEDAAAESHPSSITEGRLCSKDSAFNTTLSSSPLPPIVIQTLPSPLSPLASFVGGPLFSYLVASVIFGIGLALGALVHVSQPELCDRTPGYVRVPNSESPIPNASPMVGRITAMVDCVWEGSGFRVQNSGAAIRKSEIHLGDRLALRSGLLEITYDSGAKVILQGPVSYDIESAAGGYLAIGKLTARLDQRSEVRDQRSEDRDQRSEDRGQKPGAGNQKSFAVRTPTAIVTDLGTEFGVEVSKDGWTTSHVYRGSVRLQAVLADGTVRGESRTLTANQSARVERDKQGNGVPFIVVGAPPKPVAFLREIPKTIVKTLDLVDVVAGGDGFSGQRNGGIDPTNGKRVDAFDIKSQSPRSGDGQYHRVEGMPLVDGVFIPDGAKAEVQVDSAGHRFDGFHGTVNKTWQHIWAAGTMPNDVSPRLDNTDFTKPPHGLLYVHASNAITFDLEAVRRAHPDCKLLRFRSAAANLEPGEYHDVADIWVLVDGKARFRRQRVDSYSGVFSVVVPIGEKDRFLTLAATDGGDGISHDWVIFGDPRLELASGRQEEPDRRDGS